MIVAARHGIYGRRGLLAAVVVLCYGALCWEPERMALLGIPHFGFWFLDTHALLAASDAYALGLDPYGSNPLDLFHQPHQYSYWWFALHSFGLTRTDSMWVGAVLGFIFLAAALIQLGVRSLEEIAWSAVLVLAPPIVLGFNRANADLLVFIIMSATVPCLLSPRPLWRWIGMGTILLAASLKFYPAMAGIVLLVSSRPRREIIKELLVFGALLALLAIDQVAAVERYVGSEEPWGFFTFGAGLWTHLLSTSHGLGVIASSTLGIGAAVFWWYRAPKLTVAPDQRENYLRFLLGAVLLTGCYFATVNYAYRAVFALWMGSFLATNTSHANWPTLFRKLSRLARLLLLPFLWLDGLLCLAINLSHRLTASEVATWTDRLVLAEQPLTATLMVALLGFIVPFVRDQLRELFFESPALSETPSASSIP